jgi:hypothetical protein
MKDTFSALLSRKTLIHALFAGLLVVIMTPLTVFAEETVPIEIFGFYFGSFDALSVSIPVLTFFVALIDGFNPCAMWVLLFLISLLLDMKEVWKRWYLGGVFLLTTAVAYYLFLLSWLKINELIGLIPITRAIIAIAAWIVGFWSINSYLQHRKEQQTGCKVGESEDRKKMFSRIREILQRQNLAWMTVGIIILAFSVNLFELLCSAALPATYTNILASQGIDGLGKYLYLLLYVIVFALDDFLVFAIAMVTLQATGITTKYNNLIKLISGIIMLILAGWITIEVMTGLGIL